MPGTRPGMMECVFRTQAKEYSVLLLFTIFLCSKSLGLHRQMHLVLERGIAIGGEQSSVIGNRFAQRLDPGAVAFDEIRQHMSMDDIFQIGMTGSQPIAGMTDAKPYPLIIVAD